MSDVGRIRTLKYRDREPTATMPTGIRVTVGFPAPTACPVASVTERSGATVEDVTTSVATDGTPVSEFLLDADAVPEEYEHDPVFTYADRHLFRVAHVGDCPCTCLGEFDTPVERYHAADGDLTLTFHVREFDRLQTIVGELRDRFPDVDIQRLVRAPTSRTAQDTVFVDRGRLTDRQLEVLDTAFEMGYFADPREANATDVAEALEITPSTFSEHLLAVQRKLFEDVLEDW